MLFKSHAVSVGGDLRRGFKKAACDEAVNRQTCSSKQPAINIGGPDDGTSKATTQAKDAKFSTDWHMTSTRNVLL